jgi:hypothetical protein
MPFLHFGQVEIMVQQMRWVLIAASKMIIFMGLLIL